MRKLRARGVNQSHALIVGTGRLARRTARTLHSISWSGIQTVGFVEDEAHRVPDGPCPSSAAIAELPELVERHHIEHVFIALPLNRYADARRVFDAPVADGRGRAADRRRARRWPGMTFHTTQLHGMTVIGLRESPHHGLNVVVKRAMDVILAPIALVLARPAHGAASRCS